MRPRKPLKLLLNFTLWGKLVPFVTPGGFPVFAVKTSKNDEYKALYSKNGSKIFDKSFIVLGMYDQYLYIEETDCYFKETHILNIIDCVSGKKIHNFSVDAMPCKITAFSMAEYEGRKILCIDTGDSLRLANTEGNVLEFDVEEALQIEEKLFYNARKKTYVLTKYYEDSYDYVFEVPGEKPMFLCGIVRNGEIIYQAMGSKGFRPWDYYFKKYSNEKDGIVVKLCDENGEDLNTLAFIKRDNGRVTEFVDARSVYGFTDERVFVTRINEGEFMPDIDSRRVDLCYYDGSVIDTYKEVYYGFLDIEYGIFTRRFAIAEDEDGEFFYIDPDGERYPIGKSFKNNFDSYHSISSEYRNFEDPLEWWIWHERKAHAFFIAQKKNLPSEQVFPCSNI